MKLRLVVCFLFVAVSVAFSAGLRQLKVERTDPSALVGERSGQACWGQHAPPVGFQSSDGEWSQLPESGSAQTETSKEKLKTELAALEDAFCAMAREQGILAAFQHFAAPDVAFIDTDPRQWRGPAAVQQRMGADRPGVSLTWSAYFTDVSDDGTLGYNYGRYESRGPGPDGREMVRGGWFLSIWKRQPDGSWKYVMDNGAPDRPAAPPPKPVVSSGL